MIINRIYEHQNLLSLYLVSFLVGQGLISAPFICVGFQVFTAGIVHIGMFWENVLPAV